MNDTSVELNSPLLPLISVLTSTLVRVQNGFNSIPGSPILIRYIRSSYQVSCLGPGLCTVRTSGLNAAGTRCLQNDPYRSLLELFLVVFALRTLFSRRTRGEGQSRNWVELTEKVRTYFGPFLSRFRRLSSCDIRKSTSLSMIGSRCLWLILLPTSLNIPSCLPCLSSQGLLLTNPRSRRPERLSTISPVLIGSDCWRTRESRMSQLPLSEDTVSHLVDLLASTEL